MSKAVVFVPPTLSLNEANEFATALRTDRRGFTALAALLHELTGINLTLTDKNLSLMAGRLAPLLRQRNIKGYAPYHQVLRTREPELTREFIAALTTHTTEFFREGAHFEKLPELVRGLIRDARRRGEREVRIWSAACSTGQEPYTILMTLMETVPELFPGGLKLLATDIDMEVLTRASYGFFSESEMQSVPPLYRQKYFNQWQDPHRRRFRANRELCGNVHFAPFNLADAEFSFKYPFDVIFCRNVLIYFEKDMVAQVLGRLCDCLRPGGYLVLGHSESGTLRSPQMSAVATAVYRKKGGG